MPPRLTAPWHFVALTFDGTKAAAQNRVAIYLDGVAQPLTPAGYGNPTSLDTAANLSDFYLAADFGTPPSEGEQWLTLTFIAKR